MYTRLTYPPPDMQGSVWTWKVSHLKELFYTKWYVSSSWHLFVSPMYICRKQTRQPIHKQHEDGLTRGCVLQHWPFGTPPVTDGFFPFLLQQSCTAHYSDATNESWRIESPATRLLSQELYQTNKKNNKTHQRSLASKLHQWPLDSLTKNHYRGLVSHAMTSSSCKYTVSFCSESGS